jgi:hypothetical protein
VTSASGIPALISRSISFAAIAIVTVSSAFLPAGPPPHRSAPDM